MRSVSKASDSMEALVELMPQEATKIDKEGYTKVISVSELKKGDYVLIKPGEKKYLQMVSLLMENPLSMNRC